MRGETNHAVGSGLNRRDAGLLGAGGATGPAAD